MVLAQLQGIDTRWKQTSSGKVKKKKEEGRIRYDSGVYKWRISSLGLFVPIKSPLKRLMRRFNAVRRLWSVAHSVSARWGPRSEFFPGAITFRGFIFLARLQHSGDGLDDADLQRTIRDVLSMTNPMAKKRAKSEAKNVALDSCHSRFADPFAYIVMECTS